MSMAGLGIESRVFRATRSPHANRPEYRSLLGPKTPPKKHPKPKTQIPTQKHPTKKHLSALPPQYGTHDSYTTKTKNMFLQRRVPPGPGRPYTSIMMLDIPNMSCSLNSLKGVWLYHSHQLENPTVILIAKYIMDCYRGY